MSLENQLITWALRRWIKPKSLREQTIAESRALTSRVPWGAKLALGWRIRATSDGEWIEPADPDHAARQSSSGDRARAGEVRPGGSEGNLRGNGTHPEKSQAPASRRDHQGPD